MKFLSLQFASLFTALLVAQSSVAQNTLISEDEALKNFKEAAKFYREDNAGEELAEKADEETKEADVEGDIPMLEYVVEDKEPETARLENAEPIEKTVVQINIENQTLEDVVGHVVDSARATSGDWQVKWRLSPENNYIREERVNITAETDLNGFMKFLADRVNNMTGVQLFVTVFDKAHIIVISDTYY